MGVLFLRICPKEDSSARARKNWLTKGHEAAIIMKHSKCESAGTGRQARLRAVWQQSWEFDSPLSHQRSASSVRGLPIFTFLIFSTILHCGILYKIINRKFDEVNDYGCMQFY